MGVEREEQIQEAERIARGLLELMAILMEEGRSEIPYPLFVLFEVGLERIRACLMAAENNMGGKKL